MQKFSRRTSPPIREDDRQPGRRSTHDDPAPLTTTRTEKCRMSMKIAPFNFTRFYDVTPDGERFVMVKDGSGADELSGPELVWVQNWFQELTERVPVN